VVGLYPNLEEFQALRVSCETDPSPNDYLT